MESNFLLDVFFYFMSSNSSHPKHNNTLKYITRHTNSFYLPY